MSPVEPSPEVIGTIGLPSTECPSIACPDDFVLAACSLGANRLPVAAPREDKNERRFQPDFKLMRGSLLNPSNTYLATGGAEGMLDGSTTSALPTISMSESPGIHSSAIQARDGALPGLKYVP